MAKGVEIHRADADAKQRVSGLKREFNGTSQSVEEYFKELEENGELICCSVAVGRLHRRECFNIMAKIKHDLSRAIEGETAWNHALNNLKECHRCKHFSEEGL